MINTKDLLRQYREKNNTQSATIISFSGVDTQDVYNITAPFILNQKEVIAGRIESRENENSSVGLFEEIEPNNWQRIKSSIDLSLQDPFVTQIDGKTIIGGVEVSFLKDGTVKWRTIFYHLKNYTEVEKIFEGPWGMKDLRLKQLSNGQILVLTRPQGEKGGRGKIGATIINDFAELSIEIIENTPLLANQFIDEEWGGANEVHEINDELWVLSHIANFDADKNRHYYAMIFRLDIDQLTVNDAKIIAERKNFKPGPTKRPDLYDVVFSGGLQLTDKAIFLYAGISDAGAQKIQVKNPFSKGK